MNNPLISKVLFLEGNVALWGGILLFDSYREFAESVS